MSPLRTLVLVALISCAPAWTASPVAEAGPKPVTGDLRVSVRDAIRYLDPALAHHDAERLCVVNLFDQLYEYVHDKQPFELRPLIAAAMPEISEDRKTYTIRIRKGIRYPDDACFPDGKGREVTAHDVVFCFKRLMDGNVPATGRWLFQRKLEGIDAFTEASGKLPKKPNRGSYTKEQGYPDVAGLKALDDHTLQIRVAVPYPALTWVLAHSYASIYPPEAITKYGADFGRKPVGCGPYVLKSFVGETQVRMARREDMATAFPKDGRTLPRQYSVIVQREADPRKRWDRFLAGEFDLAPLPVGWAHEVFDSRMGQLPTLQPYGLTLHMSPELNIQYVAFNMQDKVIGQPAGEQGRAIRRAISLVWDDGWTHHPYWSALVEPLAGPLLPELPAYTEYYTNDYERYSADGEEEVKLAKKLLAEAGLPGDKGIPIIPIDVSGTGKDGSEKEFARIQKRLALVGIRCKPNYLPYSEIRRRIDAREATIWTISWRLDYPDPENLLQLFYGPAQPVPNDSGYRNADYDALYEEALTLPPGEDRALLYQEMQDMVAEDCPYIWTFRWNRFRFTHGWIEGWADNDICSKWFKYCKIDLSKRNAFRENKKTRDAKIAAAKAALKKAGG